MIPLIVKVAGMVQRLRRHSKARNLRRLRRHGHALDSFVIREATVEDASTVAHLHVVTWKASHGLGFSGPSYDLRLDQWTTKFRAADPDWFCFIVEDPRGTPVGFANGHRYSHPSPTGFAGQLEKIYLLADYQRLGFGRRLICRVARRFLERDISSMLLFSQPENPACRFFEALGGEKLLTESHEFHGGYGWRHLDRLVAHWPD